MPLVSIIWGVWRRRGEISTVLWITSRCCWVSVGGDRMWLVDTMSNSPAQLPFHQLVGMRIRTTPQPLPNSPTWEPCASNPSLVVGVRWCKPRGSITTRTEKAVSKSGGRIVLSQVSRISPIFPSWARLPCIFLRVGWRWRPRSVVWQRLRRR